MDSGNSRAKAWRGKLGVGFVVSYIEPHCAVVTYKIQHTALSIILVG